MNDSATNEPLKRPALLVVISLLIMAGCVLVGGGSAALLADVSPVAKMIGATLVLFSTVVGVTQYFAVFRRNEWATRVAAGMLLFLCAAYGVMSLFAVSVRISWPESSTILAVAAFLGWAAWKNYQWRFALRKHYRQSPKPPERWQVSLTEILGVTVAVAVAAAIASYKISNLPKP
jgi:hypothetical protein